MSKTYVYDGKEVEATGRTAVRQSSRGRTHVLYEIKPTGMETADPQFHKWVKLEDLYHIQDNVNTDGEDDENS